MAFVKKMGVSSDYEVSTLQCSGCSTVFHGSCLSLDESVIPFLFVVERIGGWCCLPCRGRLSSDLNRGKSIVSKTTSPHTSETSLDSITTELNEIRSQMKSLNDLLRSTKPVSASREVNAAVLNPVVWPSLARSNIKESTDDGVCSSDIGGDHSVKPTGSSKLNNELRTALLSAVHGEFKSISQRSMNVLVSGLPIRGDISDSDQFVKLCDNYFGLRPNIRSLVRLGDVKKEKIQPLLVSLKSKDEADHLIEFAKVLRTASDKLIRDQVYFNKHLTRAEAAAAFEARERFREKKKRDSLKQSTLQADRPSKSSPTNSSSLSLVPPLIDLSMGLAAGGLKDHPLMMTSDSGGVSSKSSISHSVNGVSVS